MSEHWIEFLLAFIVAPGLIYLGLIPVIFSIPLLVVVAIAAAFLARAQQAPLADLGMGLYAGHQTLHCTAIGLAIWAVAQLALAIVRIRRGERVFAFAHSQPILFAAIVVIYFFSVVAQEFVYRSFFFWRYENLGPPWMLLALNAIAFGWAHIVFRSWIPVLATLAGGALFSWLFLQFHSFTGVCIVHMAFGLSIFAMGFGNYFYTGSGGIALKFRPATLSHLPS